MNAIIVKEDKKALPFKVKKEAFGKYIAYKMLNEIYVQFKEAINLI